MILPDYTRLVQQQRQSFMAAKRRLRDLNIQYMLLYPAQMRVTYNSKSYFFDSPEAVFTWTDERTHLTLHSPQLLESDSS